MERIRPQMVVKDKMTGRFGVTVKDLPGMLSCCTSEETPVVFEGHNASTGILTEDLEIIGPERALADPEKCGAGKGKSCCIFLTVGRGFICERFGELRWDLIFRKEKMNSKREPTELFPKCQLA